MDKLLENKILNDYSWNLFIKRLNENLNNPKFIKELKNTNIIYNTYFSKQTKLDNLENLLKQELKINFWFFNCEEDKFITKFKQLPFNTKVILLQYCIEKNIKINITKEDIDSCLNKINKVKENLALKILDFSLRGFKQTYLPLKTFIVILQYNCFDLEKNKDQFIIEFFSKYLSNKEVEGNFVDKKFYDFCCQLLYSTKVYNDFYIKYNSKEIKQRINNNDLSYKKDIQKNTNNDFNQTELSPDELEIEENIDFKLING